MATTHESQITHWMSRLAETAYGTRRIAGAPYRRILTTDRSPWSTPTAFENNAGEANGSDMPTETWATTNDARKSFALSFNFQDIGYWLQMALGSVSVSGTTPDFTHLFTPQSMNTSRQLPSRTFGQKIGGLKIDILGGVCVDSLTISGGRSGRLGVSASVIGDGYYQQDPASYAEPSLETDRVFGYANQAAITVNDGSTTTDYTCQLESWSWEFANNLMADDGYRVCSPLFTAGNFEGGTVRKDLLVGARSYRFRFTARLQSADPMRNLMKAGTYVTLNNTITGGTIPTGAVPFSLELEHTRGRIVSADETIEGGFAAISGEIDLMSNGSSIPLSVSLTNNVSSYVS